jgi:hypothetical protein
MRSATRCACSLRPPARTRPRRRAPRVRRARWSTRGGPTPCRHSPPRARTRGAGARLARARGCTEAPRAPTRRVSAGGGGTRVAPDLGLERGRRSRRERELDEAALERSVLLRPLAASARTRARAVTDVRTLPPFAFANRPKVPAARTRMRAARAGSRAACTAPAGTASRRRALHTGSATCAR